MIPRPDKLNARFPLNVETPAACRNAAPLATAIGSTSKSSTGPFAVGYATNSAVVGPFVAPHAPLASCSRKSIRLDHWFTLKQKAPIVTPPVSVWVPALLLSKIPPLMFPAPSAVNIPPAVYNPVGEFPPSVKG